MIEKLHRKFVVIATSSLMLIMVLIIGAINLINLYQTSNRLDGVLKVISENDGRIPEPPRDRIPLGPGRGFSFDFELTPETRFETRYFTVTLDPDYSILGVDVSYVASISEELAVEYAEKILAKSKTKGYLGEYRYLLEPRPEGALLIVMNCHMQLQTVYTFFWISCFIALASLLLMFVLVSLLSRRALQPVKVSLEKQKQFITDAGHEIKTPLAIISSNADVLEITQGDSEWVTSIRKQTMRLDNLVKKLLTLSKMEEETLQQAFAPFDLSRLVQETAESFLPMTTVKGQIIQCDVRPGISCFGDQDEICQVIAVLLENAVKYAPGDSEIAIRLEAYAKKVRLEIRNRLDVPPVDDPERLFDRFFRADASRSRESGGYGIGLSIAKAAAKVHKGDIQAFYEDDRQVICFRLILPKQ